MSTTHHIKEVFKTIMPDAHTMRMTYEDGGKIEVWSTASKTVRLRAGATIPELKAAFEADK